MLAGYRQDGCAEFEGRSGEFMSRHTKSKHAGVVGQEPHMIRSISVTPVGSGWTVRSEPFDNEMHFFSGAKAESAARRMGSTITKGGDTAEIRIFLRDGSLAARFLCPPQVEAML